MAYETDGWQIHVGFLQGFVYSFFNQLLKIHKPSTVGQCQMGKKLQTQYRKNLRSDFLPEEETDKQAVVIATTGKEKIEPW